MLLKSPLPSIILFWGNIFYATLALLQQSTYKRPLYLSTRVVLLKPTRSNLFLCLKLSVYLRTLVDPVLYEKDYENLF